MKIIKRLGLYFSLVTIIGCSSPQNSTSNYLNLNLGAEPSFLNPILHSDSASSSVSGLLFNGLMKVNSDLEIEPDLAESYTISKNGLIYTIKLKPSIFFHDGHPLDAEDVVFTFQTILNPKTNTVRRSNYQINGKNIRFESIDSLTVKISLPEPFSPFLTNLTMGILPKHLLENEDINTSDFNRNPIGTGPFKFVDWRPSQYVKLERNDQYFYKKAKVPGILMKIIPDKNTARISLQKGEIDIEGGVQAKDVTLLEKETHLNLYDYYSLGYTYIGLNLTKEPFNNRQFRLALSHAINRESIVKSVLRGYGKPSILPSSEELWAYPDNTRAINVYGYNPEKSKQLLMEMGYTFNESSGYFEKEGQTLGFTLMTNKGNKYREKTAQIVQRFLENVGIKVSIQLMEWSAFIKVMNDTTAFDAIIIGWGLGIDPDGYSIWHSSQFPTGFNYIGYKNTTVDRLLEQGRRVTSKKKRKAIYEKMYQEITYDIPYYFLYQGKAISAVNKRVGGIIENPGPFGVIDDIEDIYLIP